MLPGLRGSVGVRGGGEPSEVAAGKEGGNVQELSGSSLQPGRGGGVRALWA